MSGGPLRNKGKEFTPTERGRLTAIPCKHLVNIFDAKSGLIIVLVFVRNVQNLKNQKKKWKNNELGLACRKGLTLASCEKR
jgi:hypothetical protein